MLRWARLLLGAVGALLLLVAIGVFVLTQTDYGRERVRRVALGQLAGSVHGTVRIGAMRGNLLTGAIIEDLQIADTAGAPFLAVDRLSLEYSTRSLLSRRIHLSNVELLRPVIVLDRRPGEDWNFANIFPGDTTATDTAGRGFGSWLRVRDLSIREGRILVRDAWGPDSTLTGAARDSAIEAALSSENRLRVERVPGGYQSIQELRRVNAHFPLLRLADPDSTEIVVEVDRLSSVALPFRPPAAMVRDLAGQIVIGEDSLWFRDVRLSLPGSRVSAEGVYARESGGLRAGVSAAPIAWADFEWLYPALPSGGGEVRLALERRGERTHVVAEHIDLRLEEARLTGHADVQMGDSLRLGDTDLTVAGLDTRLIGRLAPDIEVPVDGTLSGRLTLAGTPASLDVDGAFAFQERDGGTSRIATDGTISTTDGFAARDLRLRLDPLRAELVRAIRPDLAIGGTITGQAALTGSTLTGFDLTGDLVHDGPRAGRSRVLADGRVDTEDGIAARDLTLRFQPLQVALARTYAPDLPVGGTITGWATVNGSPGTRLDTEFDIVHRDESGRSQLIGDARVGFGEVRRIDIDVRAPALSLATVGRFAPAAELQGDARGELRAHGTPGDLALGLTFALDAGGSIAAGGTVDLAAAEMGYDIRGRFTDFDGGALSARIPHTRLSGTVSARGRGTDPATARSTVRADLVDMQVDSVGVDAARVLVQVADGVASVERARVRLASAQADVSGRIGLTEERRGTLRFLVSVDSLSDFAGYVPADTGAVWPRPADQARRIALARVDSAHLARETEVERMATGLPPEPTLTVDTVRPIPRDSLSGSFRVEGVLAGSVDRFDLRGNASVDDLVAAGSTIGTGQVEYDWTGAGTPRSSLTVAAALDTVRAGGFAFDSVRTEASYTGDLEEGEGTATIALYEEPARDYRVRADYTLALDRKEVRLDDMVLRFDTARWTSSRPGTVSWGAQGVELETLELRTAAGGRIHADGRLRTEGEADLRVEVAQLPVSHVLALLQDTTRATGLITLDAAVAGTRAAPLLQVAGELTGASYGGTSLPTARTTLDYADREAEAHVELVRGGDRLVVADARLPIDLALDGEGGSRLLDGPLTVDLRADSLPLEALPQFTDAVANVRGRIRGSVAVRGTFDEPTTNGILNLDLGSLDIVRPGVELRDIAGTLRIRGDSLVVDSVVARSADGPIRLTGTLDIATPTEPGFDLALEARNAVVLNNELGRNVKVDADLALAGALDALRVTGDVSVLEGTLYVPESEKQLVNISDPALAATLDTLNVEPGLRPGPNPLLEGLQVDVGVRVARNTWVRNTDANVEIYTPEDAGALRVQLDNRRQALTLGGTINVDRGEYTFSGRRFELTQGSATFLETETIDPRLQLTAVHEVPRPNREPLQIQIHIGGYLSAPRITLDSNAQPPLSQTDLISYLAFGESSSSLLTRGGSGVAAGGEGGDLGALATQQLAGVALGAVVDEAVSELEQEASQSGLDVVRISPAELPAELALAGTFENLLRGTEIEAGKYLNRRLFVAAQGRPTTEAWPGMRVEYRTPGGFVWMTTWEPAYLPSQPTFATDEVATPTRVLGTFLIWERRF